MSDIPCVTVLGVKINKLDMQTAIDCIRNWIKEGGHHYIVTADSYGVALSRSDKEFKEIIDNADLVTPDSTGILLGAKVMGTPLPNRVTGCDLSKELCKAAAEDGFSIYLFGAKPGVAEQAAHNLCELFPTLKIAGTRDGYFKDSENDEIVSKIKESGAKVILVAFGIPKQEKWIRNYLEKTGANVAIGVGGTFDVFSGNIKRAPEWMQKHGLEWLFRLIQDGSKISKVAFIPKFLLMVLKDKVCSKRNN
jgi:N-acetylglucosaminyldiphosphoundecaprenol N-acetyl-beta-D-mannosaminyltransferase